MADSTVYISLMHRIGIFYKKVIMSKTRLMINQIHIVMHINCILGFFFKYKKLVTQIIIFYGCIAFRVAHSGLQFVSRWSELLRPMRVSDFHCCCFICLDLRIFFFFFPLVFFNLNSCEFHSVFYFLVNVNMV